MSLFLPMPRSLHSSGKFFLCILLSGINLLAACGTTLPPKPERPPGIYDDLGRRLILHGLNDLSEAKHAPGGVSSLTEPTVEREAKSWGFNFVRYLIFWKYIEPQKGFFDKSYLDKTAVRVNWYAKQNMHVLLDMHQDIYGYATDGNGAPEWATETDGVALTDFPVPAWWLKNIDRAVINAYKNFWEYDRYKYLQDHFIQSWRFVASHFANNEAVIGYDLLNEPHGGDVLKTWFANFERDQLVAMYRRLLSQIREVDPDTWLFFEPQAFGVNFGRESALPRFDDPGSRRKLVYSPHMYPFFFHEGNGLTKVDQQQLADWRKNRLHEMARHNTTMMVGEFGGSEDQRGGMRYYRDQMAWFDANLVSWALWSGDEGNWGPTTNRIENKKMQVLVRPYPQATAGNLLNFKFAEATSTYTMNWDTSKGVEGATEIFVPARHYPDGWQFDFSDPSGWSCTWDAEYSRLKILHNNKLPTHFLNIQPTGDLPKGNSTADCIQE